MEVLPQILVFSLIASAIYALLAAGLNLTFGTLEFINFAHGDLATLGAYTFYSSYILSELPLAVSALITVFILAIFGIIIEKTTFKPVRDRQEFIPLILSIGLAIIIQAFVTLKYGAGSQTYYQGSESTQTFNFLNGNLVITLPQIVIILSAIVLLSSLWAFLKYSKTGKAIRAVADNKEVAAILGIDINKTLTIVFALSTALAGIAGFLIAFDSNLYPKMGLVLGIKVFAAIIMGGVGKFKGAILGAIIIGFSENLIIGLTNIPGSFKELIVFSILIIILIFKPYGLLGGKKEEVESRI